MKALAAALVKAQLAADAVGKGSTNAHMKYKYASAEAMLAEGREALAGAGLALLQKGWEVSADRSMVLVQYLLLHESGESLEWAAGTSVVPGPGRPQDKSEAAALTYSIAYTIRGLLLLPRVDDTASVDARDDRHHEPRRPVGHDRQRLTRHDQDGVVTGPMNLTEHASAEQVLQAIRDCPAASLQAVVAWLAKNGEEHFPDDLKAFRAAYAARVKPADPTDAAIRGAAKPLTADEQAALDAAADDTREP